MKATELLRLVALNINQNKFKSVMTSIGIVVGAATIVLVIGIGKGGQMEVAEQFAELNAGAIDISYDYAGEEETGSGGFSFGNIGQMFGNLFGGRNGGGSSRGGEAAGNGMPEGTGEAGGMPQGDMSGGEMPEGGFSGGEMPEGGFSGGEMPEGGFSGGEMPEGGFSGEEMPEDGFPGGEMPEDGASGEEMPEDGSSGGDIPEGSQSGDAMEDAPSEGTLPGTEADGEQENAGTGESGSENGTEADDSGETSETETETSMVEERLNQEQIILTQGDVEDIERYVEGISGATISYSAQASIEGAELTSAKNYTVAGVKESYAAVSKLVLKEGAFLTEGDDDTQSRVCVLGSSVASELFGSEAEIEGSTLYIDDRTYTVVGVLEQTSTVSAGISPDTTIFIPYETGIKYVTGEEIDPVITVLASDVNTLSSVIEDVRTVLEENYSNAEFTFEDSGSRMEAAQSSNETLTLLLSAMAAIVFPVGGIGIMNVLFVSVKERTNEIGILKAIGTSRSSILVEFLVESAAISCIGGVLGVVISLGVVPVVEHFDVRIQVSVFACAAALGFAILTGTIFGIYPAWKASRLEPVEALNAE